MCMTTEQAATRQAEQMNAIGVAHSALRDCMGAIGAMRDQIEQMRGLFSDEDGAIAEALEAADDAEESARAALAA